MYLHSNSTQVLAYKKRQKHEIKKKINNLYFMQLFSAEAMIFSKKKFQNFLTPKKWKNRPQKLLIIGLTPFFPIVQPRPQPTAQNWFFILWNLGTRRLFSYLWFQFGFLFEDWLQTQNLPKNRKETINNTDRQFIHFLAKTSTYLITYPIVLDIMKIICVSPITTPGLAEQSKNW